MDVCEGLCTVGDLSNYLKRRQSVLMFLCLFWRKDHTKSCAHKKPVRLEDMTKDVVRSETLKQRVRLSSPRCGARQSALRRRCRAFGGRSDESASLVGV